MLSQRQLDINAFTSNIGAIDSTIDKIHIALATALKKASTPKDKRSQARQSVYSLLANCLSKNALEGLEVGSLEIVEVTNFFTALQNKTLLQFYAEMDPENLLTNDDKEFFNHTIQIFKALIFTRFHYQDIKNKIETFTPELRNSTLTTINLIADDFNVAENAISRFSKMDIEIENLKENVRAQHDKLLDELFLNNDEDDPNTKNTYTKKYARLHHAYLSLINQYNKLNNDQNSLLAERTQLDELKKLPAETTTSLQQDISGFNEKIEKHNKNITDTLSILSKVNAAANSLFARAENLITTYSDAATALNKKIRDKNDTFLFQTNNLNKLTIQLDGAAKSITDMCALNNDATTPIQAMLATKESKPDAKYANLKENSLFSGSRDEAWTTLASTVSESLKKLSDPVTMLCLKDFDAPIEQANKQKAAATTALAAYSTESEQNTVVETAHKNIDENKKTVKFQRDLINARAGTLTSIGPVTLPVISKPVLIRKVTPVKVIPVLDVPETESNIVIPANVQKKPGFFRRHWKALAIGTLVGVAVAGTIAACIFTFGIAGVVAAGTIATVLGASATAGAAVGGGLFGAGACAAGAGIVDARQNNRNLYKLDLPPESAPVANAPRSKNGSTLDLSFTPARAPLRYGPERGGANDNPFASEGNAALSTNKATLFNPYNHTTTQLFHTNQATHDELKTLLGWLEEKKDRAADYKLLEKLQKTLKLGCDVRLSDREASCFVRLREEYRNGELKQHVSPSH